MIQGPKQKITPKNSLLTTATLCHQTVHIFLELIKSFARLGS